MSSVNGVLLYIVVTLIRHNAGTSVTSLLQLWSGLNCTIHFICAFLFTDDQTVTVHLRASVLVHNSGNEAVLEEISIVSTNNVHILYIIQLQYQKNIINGRASYSVLLVFQPLKVH